MNNYNLIYEKWIPVLYKNGLVEKVGIKHALLDAHLIYQIATNNPMDRISILRFLLAVLYWCNWDPQDEQNQKSIAINQTCLEKLDLNKDSFNLFGGDKRFYQIKVRIDEKDKKSVNSLYHEIPTGTNINHLRHTLDFQHGLCPACCAIGLLRLPVFTTQGGKGLMPGINNKPPIYFFPLGETLAQTLLLAYQKVGNVGYPNWDDNFMEYINNEIPLLYGLTCLPRIVWLDNPIKEDYCDNCGQKGLIVQKCIFKSKLLNVDKSKWKDPNVIYYFDKSNKQQSLGTDFKVLKEYFTTDKPWTRLVKLFLENNVQNEQKYLFVGFASDKVKFINLWERVIDFRDFNSKETLRMLIDEFENSLFGLPKKIADSNRMSKIREKSIIRELRPYIENTVYNHLYELLNDNNSSKEFFQALDKMINNTIINYLYPKFSIKSIIKNINLMEANLLATEEKNG